MKKGTKLRSGQSILFVSSLVLLVVGLVLSQPDNSNLCFVKESLEYGRYWDCLFGNFSDISKVGHLLVPASVSFALISFTMLFTNRAVFSSWLKFALFVTPLFTFLILIAPENSNSWMPLFFISQTTMSIWLSALFSVLSLGLIAWKQFFSRK